MVHGGLGAVERYVSQVSVVKANMRRYPLSYIMTRHWRCANLPAELNGGRCWVRCGPVYGGGYAPGSGGTICVTS